MTESLSGSTVPLWTGKATAFGRTHYYIMVGTSPFTPEGTNQSTTVPADVIPVDLTFADTGHVFSSSATDGACGLSASAQTLTLQSPLFLNRYYGSYGTHIGTTQYEDAFQRMNFGKEIFGASAPNPDYHVLLGRRSLNPVSITVPAADGTTDDLGWCSPIGLMSISYWDNLVQTSILPTLRSRGLVSSTQLPVLLLYNVVMYQGTTSDCCVLGYHSGYQPAGAGVQYYSVADFDSTGGAFGSGTSDVSPLSHELGEWMDDPNGQNNTPSWGHIGQVSGCQNNLEVGDPLSGTLFPAITMGNGYTYHVQELAFVSWFYRLTGAANPALHSWYSNNNTFTSGAGAVC